MTDTGNEERPLTRRELRARERAFAEASREEAQGESVDADSAPEPEAEAEAPQVEEVGVEAREPASEDADEPESAEEPLVAEPEVVEPVAEDIQVEEPAVDEAAVEGSAVDEPALEEPAPTEAMSIQDLLAEQETQPIDPEDLPSATDEGDSESEALVEPEVEAAEPKRPMGRFFGRRKLAPEADVKPPNDFDELLGTSEPDDVVEVEKVEPVAADEPSLIEVAEQGDESVVEVSAVESADSPEVEAPAHARGLRIDENRRQNLDAVRDDEIDSIEIDEVEVTDARISAQSVSEKTPAQLEDTRGTSFEQETEQPSGPSRGRNGRLPFVVNVVEDTSEHHISDLRRASENGQGQNVGSGSGNITANALVLPATGHEDEIQFESEDGVLVTGSIDLPDGYASSGRARGKFDSSDIDSAPDGTEVSNPETAPVKASRAVSSYANARVNIAPKRQSRSALPWALGLGGGAVFGGIIVVVIGYSAGWWF